MLRCCGGFYVALLSKRGCCRRRLVVVSAQEDAGARRKTIRDEAVGAKNVRQRANPTKQPYEIRTEALKVGALKLKY